MKRGVIIDLKDNYAVVLTPDGHFVKTRNADSRYQLGQEIAYDAAEASRVSSYLRRGLSGLQQLRIGFITAAAIILLFFSLYPVFNSDKVYAYMTIDINPSFELAINGDMKVVRLDPLNEDGEKLLASFPDWSGEGIQSVVKSIISQSQSMGYAANGKEVLITTIIDRKNDKNFEQSLLNRVQLIKTSLNSSPLTIETAESDMDTRDKAKSEGVSTGTYIRNHSPSSPDQPAVPDVEEGEKKQPDSQDPDSNQPDSDSKQPPSEKPAEKPAEPAKKETEDKKCDDCKDKPKDREQQPDPDALKEMEKKGKQPPVVPPNRDAPPAQGENRPGERNSLTKPGAKDLDKKENSKGKKEGRSDEERGLDKQPKKKEKPDRTEETGPEKKNSKQHEKDSHQRKLEKKLKKPDSGRSPIESRLREKGYPQKKEPDNPPADKQGGLNHSVERDHDDEPSAKHRPPAPEKPEQGSEEKELPQEKAADQKTQNRTGFPPAPDSD